MFPKSKVLVLAGSVAGLLTAGTLATAQGTSTPTQSASAEARLAWAKRHVELVCRPLEEQRQFDKATRCYNDVARLMGASTRETTTAASAEAPATAAAPALPPKPAAERIPAPAASAP